jgi:prepilin-type N-terminal cleavage/methylation domain-containing protein
MDPRRAFTVIELLVVIAIIATLASFLLVAIPRMRFAAKSMDTQQRMQNVLSALQQVGQADGSTAYVIQRDGLGDDFNWVAIRHILERFKTQGTLTAQPNNVPPNLRLRIGGPPEMQDANFRLDNQVCWLYREPTGKQIAAGGWVVAPFDHFSDSKWNPLPSRLHESLDTTLEVIPDTQRPTSWYLQRWPKLQETGTAPSLVHTCWPDSDWDLAAPGTVPPRWSSPWGRPVQSRAGALVNSQYAPHTLDQLSPLNTIPLLQLAGIVPPGPAGADAFRNDRATNRAWNDRWGNPLIVVNAVFLPPRYDYDLLPAGGPESTDDLKGGRDFLLNKAKTNYTFVRAVYLAVGAVGPIVRTPPAGWAAADDAVVLRDYWLQIRDTANAAAWSEASFSKPPWQSIKVGRKANPRGDERCFITAPVEVH